MDVPLNESGVATVIGYAQAVGTVGSPNAFQTITSVFVPAGDYTIDWQVALSGVVGAPEINNFILKLGAVTLANSVNAGAVGTYPQASVKVHSPGATLVIIAGSNVGTAGSNYTGTLFSESADTLVRIAPSFGSSWSPSTVSVKATSAVKEASCRIYLGTDTNEINFVDGTLSGSTGDSTDRITGPFWLPDSIIARWSGADIGAQVTLSVLGSKGIPG